MQRLNESCEIYNIIEGGASQHLSHIWDEKHLTFGELKTIIQDVLTGKIEMTEKCISGDSIIQTTNGPIKIKEYVDNKHTENVLSYNEATNSVEYKKVEESFNNDTDDDWLEIETDDGKILKVTPNHRIFTNGVYIKAEDLKIGDQLVTL